MFRAAVDNVRPLKADNRKPLSSPATTVSRRNQDTRTVAKRLFTTSRPVIDDLEQFRRAGVQLQRLQKLHRGQLPIQAELDLHGCTQVQAEDQLHKFISDCLVRNLRRIRIIHGKGKGSTAGTAVLRMTTRSWLQGCSAVLAYATPTERQGGSGAVDVLLIRIHL